MNLARIEAIPTTRFGVRFRSKLEADWATCFDRRCILWSYEVQGFDMGGLNYLPDFWLPQLRTVVEVKGILDLESEEKVCRLAKALFARDILVVLALSPAGGLWMPVTNEGFGESRAELNCCPCCLSWQFAIDICRVCSPGEREAYPGAYAFLAGRLRQWAEEEYNAGSIERGRDLDSAARQYGGG